MRSINFPRHHALSAKRRTLLAGGHNQHHSNLYLFDETPQRDTTARLAAQVRAAVPDSALLFLKCKHRGGAPLDGYAFTPALAACAALSPASGGGLLVGLQIHALGIKMGSLTGHIALTALLDMYGKCDGGHPHEAVRVFDEMKTPNRDAVAWNALLSCFVRHGRAADAVAAFRSMTLGEGVESTGFTLATLLKACGSLKARRQGEQVHASLVAAGARDSVVLGTALVDFYSYSGLIDDAVRVFDHLECRKDDAAYGALINGFIQNGRYAEAFATLRKMEANATVLTSALSACAESCNLHYGKQIHCIVIRRGFTSNTALCNALLHMYAKCGAVGQARCVFDQTKKKDVVSWTSIIHAYGSHGHGGDAVRLFREMEEGEPGGGRVPPNAATFLSVLSACGHSGLVESGRECFVAMKERYGLDPGPEHHACFIDLLGRAGQIEEAWDLFMGMGSDGSAERDDGVCAAMLNACGACMDVERGELVAQRLLAWEPESPGIYILVSNFYAAVGGWDKVEELRTVMKARGLRKEGGRSWVGAERRKEAFV